MPYPYIVLEFVDKQACTGFDTRAEAEAYLESVRLKSGMDSQAWNELGGCVIYDEAVWKTWVEKRGCYCAN
jgi:hypothetical protein